jgi:hypothetical protein
MSIYPDTKSPYPPQIPVSYTKVSTKKGCVIPRKMFRDPKTPLTFVTGNFPSLGRIIGCIGFFNPMKVWKFILDNLNYFGIGNHFFRVPLVPIKWHIFNESNVHRSVLGPANKICDFIFVQATHDNTVDLQWVVSKADGLVNTCYHPGDKD